MANSKTGSPRTKIWLVVGGIIVLAVVGYVAKLYPPAKDDLAGSVVPADRYRADTSAANPSGVALGDESVAQFMQSDLYQKIVSDRALASTLANDAFQTAMKNEAFQTAMKSDAFLNAMKSDAFQAAMKNDAFQTAMKSDAFQTAMKNEAFQSAMKSDAFLSAMKNDAMLTSAHQ